MTSSLGTPCNGFIHPCNIHESEHDPLLWDNRLNRPWRTLESIPFKHVPTLEAWPTQAALTESSAAAGLTAAGLTGLEEEVACQNDAKKAAKDDMCFSNKSWRFPEMAPPNHPSHPVVMDDHFSFETHSDLGIPQFKKPLDVANVALVKIEISTPALFFSMSTIFSPCLP